MTSLPVAVRGMSSVNTTRRGALNAAMCALTCSISSRSRSGPASVPAAGDTTASTDSPEENARFAQSLDLDYPILSDPTKETARAYGVVHEGRQVPERWTFYIDKEGVIKEIDKKIQTKEAGADVAKKIKELGLASQ